MPWQGLPERGCRQQRTALGLQLRICHHGLLLKPFFVTGCGRKAEEILNHSFPSPISKSGNLFRTGARWDFPEQFAGRSYKTKTQNEDAYYYNIFIANQANQWDGWFCFTACHGEGRISMSGSMDELDKSRMSFRWRSERRKARLRVLHFGEELFATVGAVKQWNMATTRWTCAMNVGKFLEGRAMSRKKDSGE